jgi:hypothetical protein
MSVLDRRSHPRFALRCRAKLDFTSAGTGSQLNCVTRNVGIGGLLIESPVSIPKHTAVKFSMTAEGGRMQRSFEFTGSGEVVRVEPDPPGEGCLIAIESACRIDYHRVSVQDKNNLVKAGF